MLAKTPKRRAAGPAGDRYEHYAVIGNDHAATTFMSKALTSLSLVKAPEAVFRELAGARLIRFLKPNGAIRPIACGAILRRIAATSTAKVLTPFVARELCKHQYAIGRPSGSEELHKYAQIRLDAERDTAMISADVSCAFVDLEKDAAMEAVLLLWPEVEPWVRPWDTVCPTYTCSL